MNISIADMVVHIDQSLPQKQRDEIEAAVRQKACVVSASIHDKTPHLMLVAFNPDCVTSMEILDCVRENGVHVRRA